MKSLSQKLISSYPKKKPFSQVNFSSQRPLNRVPQSSPHMDPPPLNPLDSSKTLKINLQSLTHHKPQPLQRRQWDPKKKEDTVEHTVDWFNFESRIRKVIFEVVDPVTKKQFLTFEGIEEMKRQLLMMEGKNQETKDKVERNIRKCEVLE